SYVGAACIELTGKQVAPDGANICYGILSCYKQVAPTELIGNTFFKMLKGVFPIFCDFRHVLMKRCSSVNPDRVSNPVRVVLPRLHERLQIIGNAPMLKC
ncbi:hypothetical protein, partial [Candidatus Kuenenia stuttgartiensis]|uniref:hypothetical protein n=1 Tax=Kuenenia stuttgartiensis TaxID=174633 RepID=UPI001B8DAA51